MTRYEYTVTARERFYANTVLYSVALIVVLIGGRIAWVSSQQALTPTAAVDSAAQARQAPAHGVETVGTSGGSSTAELPIPNREDGGSNPSRRAGELTCQHSNAACYSVTKAGAPRGSLTHAAGRERIAATSSRPIGASGARAGHAQGHAEVEKAPLGTACAHCLAAEAVGAKEGANDRRGARSGDSTARASVREYKRAVRKTGTEDSGIGESGSGGSTTGAGESPGEHGATFFTTRARSESLGDDRHELGEHRANVDGDGGEELTTAAEAVGVKGTSNGLRDTARKHRGDIRVHRHPSRGAGEAESRNGTAHENDAGVRYNHALRWHGGASGRAQGVEDDRDTDAGAGVDCDLEALEAAKVCYVESTFRYADCSAIIGIGRRTKGDDWLAFLLDYSALHKGSKRANIVREFGCTVPGMGDKWNRRWQELQRFARRAIDGEVADPCARVRARHWGGKMDEPKPRMVRVHCGGTANRFYVVSAAEASGTEGAKR